MHRAAAVVDIDAIGIDGNWDDVRAEFFEHVGTNLIAGAVGAIDHDFESVEGERARQTRLQENQSSGRSRRRCARLCRYRCRWRESWPARAVENQFLDAALGLVIELEAFAREKLDAVVLKRIVRRRDDHAGVGAHAARQERDAGRRQRSDQPDVNAHRADARGHRGLEHVAGEARVLADQDAAMAAAWILENVRERAAEPHRGFGGDRLGVGDAAHAVGAEEPVRNVTQTYFACFCGVHSDSNFFGRLAHQRNPVGQIDLHRHAVRSGAKPAASI